MKHLTNYNFKEWNEIEGEIPSVRYWDNKTIWIILGTVILFFIISNLI